MLYRNELLKGCGGWQTLNLRARAVSPEKTCQRQDLRRAAPGVALAAGAAVSVDAAVGQGQAAGGRRGGMAAERVPVVRRGREQRAPGRRGSTWQARCRAKEQDGDEAHVWGPLSEPEGKK